jgi:hypothetical protein
LGEEELKVMDMLIKMQRSAQQTVQTGLQQAA